LPAGNNRFLVDLETLISYKMLQIQEDSGDRKETLNFIDLIQESVLGIGFSAGLAHSRRHLPGF
jgi:hypothetical protein